MLVSPYKTLRNVFSALFILTLSQLHAQLAIDESLTKDSLARLITGNGVSITNVQVKCNTTNTGRAYGYYEANTNTMGLSQGLILTTGIASDAIGPNNES